MESACGLHENQPVVQILLCRADGETVAGHGVAEPLERVQVHAHEHAVKVPLRWNKYQTSFVRSVSYLYREEVPVDFIFWAFDAMNRAD